MARAPMHLTVATAVLAVLAGCGDGPRPRPAAGPPNDHSLLWTQIYATSDPRLLLLPVVEGTRNEHSQCWVQYAARSTTNGGTISITLSLVESDRSIACPAVAVSGRFYAAVRLSKDYDGETLICAADGKAHRLAGRVDATSLRIPPM